MSKFDVMEFTCDGDDSVYVFHAKKFTKQQAIDWFIKEIEPIKTPTENDVKESFARWNIQVPENVGVDSDNGCYSFCKQGERGSFPVFTILTGDFE